tara:strand:- start:352 stop:657 length:306 start_codon:yes stop_codon:yes gene_type:complete
LTFKKKSAILFAVMRDRIRLECYTVRVDYFDKHEVDSFPKTRKGFNAAIKLAIETGFDVIHCKIKYNFEDIGDGVVWENPDNPRDMVYRATPGFEFLAEKS